MAQFKPCQGQSACRDDGLRCLTCGRSLDEIVALRELMGRLADLAVEYEYENVDEYSEYVGRKLKKLVTHRLQERETEGSPE